MGEKPTYIGLGPGTLWTRHETNVPERNFADWFVRSYEVVDTGCGLTPFLAVYARRDR